LFRPSDHDAELSEEEFRLLREFIHERFGLFFEENQRASLRSRLAGRLSGLGLSSFEDYYRYLRFGPQRVEEEARMISHLTNNETYFFREDYQINSGIDHFLIGIEPHEFAILGDGKAIGSVGEMSAPKSRQ
jgi:chemotaxis protein methyltransferase CheR